MVEELKSGEFGDCADDPAPVERGEMKVWVRDYTDNCNLPDDDRPEPSDPEWFLECG